MKLTAQRARQEALRFLAAHSTAMRSIAPKGKEDEYASSYWWPREPIYSWKCAYGDFSPATLNAAAGLVERKSGYHAYRITDAGRSALQHQEKAND